jgi:hypothetical protein
MPRRAWRDLAKQAIAPFLQLSGGEQLHRLGEQNLRQVYARAIQRCTDDAARERRPAVRPAPDLQSQPSAAAF